MSVSHRFLLLIVLAGFAISAGPFGMAAPAKTPRPKPAPAANGARPNGKVAMGEALNRKARFVTPAYIRMYHPEIIMSIATQVQAGKAKASELDGLVSPYLAGKLAAADLKPLSDRVKTQAPSSGLSGSLADGLPAPTGSAITYDDIEKAGGGPMSGAGGAAGAGSGNGGNSGPTLTLPPADYSPHSVAQGPLRVGQTSWVAVKFTNPLAGTITATLDKTFNDAAEVNSVFSYTGLMQPTPPPNGPLAPVVDQEVKGAGPLEAKAGQDCAVYVKMKFPKVGDYSLKLTIQGSASVPWSVIIPIKVKVTEMGTSGAVAETDDAMLTVIQGKTGNLPITIRPIKFKDPFDVKITAKKLPKGISVDDVTVHVDKNEKVKAILHVKADATAVKYRSEQMDLTVDFGGSEQTTLKSDVEVEAATAVYEFADKSSGDMTWNNGMLSCSADGSWYMGGSIHDSDTFFSINCLFGVFYPTSMTTGMGNTYWVAFGGGFTTACAYSGKSDWVRSHWSTILGSPPASWVYNGSPSNENTFPNDEQIPSNPVITVTEW